jgi:peroxiredoxin
MRHLLTTILVFACFSAANAQSTNEKILFKGTADAKYDGNMIMLYNRSTNDMDSALIQNGRFEISVNYKEPSRYMFYSKYEQKNKGGYAPWGIIVTKPGTVQIKAKVDSLSASIVNGAPENDLYNQYSSVSMAAQKKIMEQLYTAYGKAFLDTLTQKDPKYKEVVAEYQRLQAAAQPAEMERLEQFIKKHPASFAAVYVLAGASNSVEAAKLETLYDQLTPAWKGSSTSKNLAAKLNAAKALAIGNIAPDFTQPDTLGHNVSLKDFRGRYVLIDFWASWCGPCRAENPNVVNAFNKYKDKGFTVLGVSLDKVEARDKWIQAIHKDNLAWTHVSDLKYWDNAVARQYGIQAIPQNFLLDKEGRIIASNVKGDDLMKKLEEVIK